jgi:elongation factor P
MLSAWAIRASKSGSEGRFWYNAAVFAVMSEGSEMIEAGDLRKGTTLRVDGNLYRVMTTTYNKPGRGKATMQVSMYDLKTGNTVNRLWGAEEKVDNIYVDNEDGEYLYNDGTFLHFMNKSTFEQYECATALFADDIGYLKEGMELELRIFEGQIIDYVLPTKVAYTVAEAEAAIAGDTAGKVTKRVKTDTGLTVQVPLFVNQGDVIEIDTRDGSYLGRG